MSSGGIKFESTSNKKKEAYLWCNSRETLHWTRQEDYGCPLFLSLSLPICVCERETRVQACSCLLMLVLRLGLHYFFFYFLNFWVCFVYSDLFLLFDQNFIFLRRSWLEESENIKKFNKVGKKNCIKKKHLKWLVNFFSN